MSLSSWSFRSTAAIAKCATAISILSAARRIRYWPPSPNGTGPSCSAPRRRGCTGFWSCAPISVPAAAMSMLSRAARSARHPGSRWGLRRLLIEAGIDPQRDQVTIAPVPGAVAEGGIVNFGMSAAKALEDGLIDGFWANGMGTEIAVRRGVGTVVLDVRRGDGPKAVLQLHDVGIGHDRPADPRGPGSRGGRGARLGQDADGAQSRSRAAPPRSDASCFRRMRRR